MALWTFIILSLFPLLISQGLENSPVTEEACCKDGRDRVDGGQDCSILPYLSSSYSCRLIQEQCCTSAAEGKNCDKGVTMARWQGSCERHFFQGEHWETQIAKRCCDCCLLGLLAANWPSRCDIRGLSLSKQCTHTALVCCGENPDEAIAPTPAAEIPTTTFASSSSSSNRSTPRPYLPNDSFPTCDEPCSQLCDSNGTCSCHHGYQLESDGVSCVDVNECLTGAHDCLDGHMCINTNGSFRCQRSSNCGTGYELTDDNKCRDIDECTTGTHDCGPEFVCKNTEGSFRCNPRESCKVGFIQDAAGTCIDINECVTNTSPCQSGETCVNTLGSYTCRKHLVNCAQGYNLTEDGTRCEDVDECRTGSVCIGHSCINLVGTFRCECRVGYIFNSVSKTCDDINECRHYPGRLCGHKCENTEGSYRCSCTAGFQLAHDGKTCEDVNECDSSPCSQECTNVYGSYQCYCHRGYRLSDMDGVSCEDIDECALSSAAQVCSYKCSNSPGSFFCSCPLYGYTLAPNGRSCQDVDECASGSHSCSSSQSCFNVLGGYRCLTLSCPVNFVPASPGSTTVSLRCVKSCPASNYNCNRDSTHLVTHTPLALPTFTYLNQPEGVVYLRTTAAANPPPGGANVFFSIIYQDDQYYFDVVASSDQGQVLGIVRQIRPIIGPKDVLVEVAMDYYASGVLNYRNIVIIHVFISKFWF
ncbi:fibulin-1-like isoform X1 [Synchiropus splendidus]|uniref:fibulin-1-like isoform X1 n=1 Tax=Synchiropus splendidus TaxID=270530 RepID=UPI00237DAB6E|nr:fibulin-1-like isoform X1 [Synchiropus splendidus]